jgi:predicted small integral membrane protein
MVWHFQFVTNSTAILEYSAVVSEHVDDLQIYLLLIIHPNISLMYLVGNVSVLSNASHGVPLKSSRSSTNWANILLISSPKYNALVNLSILLIN